MGGGPLPGEGDRRGPPGANRGGDAGGQGDHVRALLPACAARSRTGVAMNGAGAVKLWGTDWLRLGLAGLAIVAVYGPMFPLLAEEWASFPSLSHGFAIPLIAAYLVWRRRQELARMAVAPSWGGFPLLAGGLALYAVGTLGGEPFVARVSFPITLLGAALFLAGVRVTKALLPGIGYLVFMIPLPYMTLKSLTDQSRLFDATATAALLPWVGVPVFQQGYLLHLPNITLEVADECSSIPAIAALLALGAAYGSVNCRTRAVPPRSRSPVSASPR